VGIGLLAESFDLAKLGAAELVDFVVEGQERSTLRGKTTIIKDDLAPTGNVGPAEAGVHARQTRTSGLFMGHKSL